ncbi:hypothetical protein K3495_g12681 [Podosphaera aphanis]|nr:hypothetical protein K3495_g12681 [Podosphaera aphanis]
MSIDRENNDDDDHESGIWVMEEHALTIPNFSGNCDIVLDTGATNHIFHDKSMFLSILPSDKSVVNASGQQILVSGVGTVKFKVYDHQDKTSFKDITMESVLPVPFCTKNLVSGIQLVSKGFGIKSSDGGLSVVSRHGVLIATAQPKGGLFCFNTVSSSYVTPPAKASSRSDVLISQHINSSTIKLMHQRFAHVGSHILEKVNVLELKIPRINSKS